MPKILCIYHGNCTDGFTAAHAVKMALGNDVDFIPGFYGMAPPDVANRHVIIVDFSFKREILLKMAEEALSIVLLDHHKTAEADLIGLPAAAVDYNNPLCNYHPDDIVRLYEEEKTPPIRVLFDMERSGAQLASDFFLGVRTVLSDYVGDRDLWRFNLPYSREVNACGRIQSRDWMGRRIINYWSERLMLE